MWHFWPRELKIRILGDFSTLDRFRVRGSISYCTRMHNPWVLSTGNVSRPSKQNFLQKSDIFQVWGWPITVQALTHLSSKSRFWARNPMKTPLECSDWLHIASGCGTGVYYELRKSQDHPSTFTHKNHDFGGAGGRLHLPSPPAPIWSIPAKLVQRGFIWMLWPYPEIEIGESSKLIQSGWKLNSR